jgi:hypothetical protein
MRAQPHWPQSHSEGRSAIHSAPSRSPLRKVPLHLRHNSSSRPIRALTSSQTADATTPAGFLQAQPGQLARLSTDGSRRGGTVTSARPDVESAAPLLHGEEPQGGSFSVEEAPSITEAEGTDFERKVRLGVNLSWAVNIMLFTSKVFVFAISGSFSVLASAVDSLVDLLSQAVLAVAEYQVRENCTCKGQEQAP